LSHPAVIAQAKVGERTFQHNLKEDAIRYLNLWADMLENEMIDKIKVPNLGQIANIKAVV
jgi:hypothetical protein